MSIAVLGAFGALAAWSIGAAVRSSRRYRRGWQLARQIAETDGVLWCGYSGGTPARVSTINGPRTRKQPVVIAVSPGGFTLVPLTPRAEPLITVGPDHLRWFGRPKKYSSGTNDLLIHAEIDGGWHVISLGLTRLPMQALIRALKEIATPEQVTAYRRRRPYVHHGPLTAQPAVQDVLGAWTLSAPLSLYLMPLSLVLLDGPAVRRVIPLEMIQNVSAIRRIDQPDAAGLVRFDVRDEASGEAESLAFALDHHEAFAAALAEAARRTLEDPVMWQRKKKKAGDDDGVFDEDE